ncbi:MAG: NAD(P)-dependent alcohol dehydrogenase [Pseudomonadota bacterium]
MSPTAGFAALERNGAIVPFNFERRALRAHDVALDIAYCGICHTDIHMIGKWGQEFPMVPGHEIVGMVRAIGPEVSKFKIGDRVAIGVMVDSCRECEPCLRGDEIYCRRFPTNTYDGIDRVDGTRTRGGYSSDYVADERFVHHVPENLDLAATAPLLCAGVTMFSPLRHWKVGPGTTVGIVGIGGLGHLGVKFARALGAHVVAFTTSPKKAESALALGAHESVLSTDAKQMAAQAYRMDFILDTVAVTYPLDPMLTALKLDGTLCSVGLPDKYEFSSFTLAMGRRSLASSGAGGTTVTREMLEFCGKHNIVADIELVRPVQIATAFERLEKADVRYRFVLDMRRN